MAHTLSLMNKTLQPFPYLGGKYHSLNWLYSHFPNHIYHLVDVFGGSGCVALNFRNAKMVTWNDYSQDIYEMMSVIRNHPEKFMYAIETTLHHRLEYKTDINENDDIIERARKTYARITQSFGRTTRNSGYAFTVNHQRYNMSLSTVKFLSKVKNLPEVIQRLRLIQFENLDWKDIFTKYDSSSTFFYLDPPYLSDTRSGGARYGLEMNKLEQHIELVDRLVTLKSQWALSCYNHPVYEKLLNHGATVHHVLAKTNGSGGSKLETLYVKKNHSSNQLF